MFYCVCVCVFTPHMHVGVTYSKELESQVVVSPKTRCLETELRFPVRAASALNHQTISPVPYRISLI